MPTARVQRNRGHREMRYGLDGDLKGLVTERVRVAERGA